MKAATQFPITHSILDANAISHLMSRSYDLGRNPHCQLLSRGANDLYIVQYDDKKFAVRVLRHGGRSLNEINYELELIEFFGNAGFGVAAPVRDKEGAFYHEIPAPEGVRYLTVFEWADGVHLWGHKDIKVYEKLGETTAQMHRISHEFSPSIRVQRKSQDYLRLRLPELSRMLVHAPDDAAFYEPLVHKTAEALDRLDPATLRFGAVHADIHPHNVFITEEGKFTLIDWDNCGDDFLAKELTAFTWRMIYAGADAEINKAYLRGYERVRRLDEAENAHMPLFLMTRHLYVLCGIASIINIVGNNFVGFQHDLHRYRGLVAATAKEAGML